MTSAPLQVVVLAAGQGKRMYSDLPKVVHPLAGRPLLAHVIGTARRLSPRRLCVVVGHGADVVRQRLADAEVEWATQEKQLDRKSTRLNSSHLRLSRMPSSA